MSIFVASVGVPLPIGLVLLASGAFAALGDFDLVLLIVIASTASVAGDSVGYWIGRRIGHNILLWLKQERSFSLISPQAVTRSQIYFQRRGGWAIFLSRFLFSGLGGVINLLSGAEVYPYRRFLLYDACGEVIGAILPLTLGFIFGASWEEVGDISATVSLFILTLIAALYFTHRLIRMIHRMKSSSAREDVNHLSGGTFNILEREQEKTDSLPP